MKKLTAFLSALALGLTAAPMTAFAETGNDTSLTEIQMGDVNADGRIDATDAAITLRYYTLMIAYVDPADIPYSDTIAKYGDVDGNGFVDGVDATQILRQYTLNSSKTQADILKEAQDVIDQMSKND